MLSGLFSADQTPLVPGQVTCPVLWEQPTPARGVATASSLPPAAAARSPWACPPHGQQAPWAAACNRWNGTSHHARTWRRDMHAQALHARFRAGCLSDRTTAADPATTHQKQTWDRGQRRRPPIPQPTTGRRVGGTPPADVRLARRRCRSRSARLHVHPCIMAAQQRHQQAPTPRPHLGPPPAGSAPPAHPPRAHCSRTAAPSRRARAARGRWEAAMPRRAAEAAMRWALPWGRGGAGRGDGRRKVSGGDRLICGQGGGGQVCGGLLAARTPTGPRSRPSRRRAQEGPRGSPHAVGPGAPRPRRRPPTGGRPAARQQRPPAAAAG